MALFNVPPKYPEPASLPSSPKVAILAVNRISPSPDLSSHLVHQGNFLKPPLRMSHQRPLPRRFHRLLANSSAVFTIPHVLHSPFFISPPYSVPSPVHDTEYVSRQTTDTTVPSAPALTYPSPKPLCYADLGAGRGLSSDWHRQKGREGMEYEDERVALASPRYFLLVSRCGGEYVAFLVSPREKAWV